MTSSSSSTRINTEILHGSRTLIVTGLSASFAYIIGNSFKDVVFALVDKWVPDDDDHLERKVLRFVIIATIFTALIVLLYKYTKPHQKRVTTTTTIVK